jgi:hypothetical protein
MAITIYTGNSVVVIDEDVVEFEYECDECDDGVEYDEDGNAYWVEDDVEYFYNAFDDVTYYFDEEADEFVACDDEVEDDEAAE